MSLAVQWSTAIGSELARLCIIDMLLCSYKPATKLGYHLLLLLGFPARCPARLAATTPGCMRSPCHSAPVVRTWRMNTPLVKCLRRPDTSSAFMSHQMCTSLHKLGRAQFLILIPLLIITIACARQCKRY